MLTLSDDTICGTRVELAKVRAKTLREAARLVAASGKLGPAYRAAVGHKLTVTVEEWQLNIERIVEQCATLGLFNTGRQLKKEPTWRQLAAYHDCLNALGWSLPRLQVSRRGDSQGWWVVSRRVGTSSMLTIDEHFAVMANMFRFWDQYGRRLRCVACGSPLNQYSQTRGDDVFF